MLGKSSSVTIADLIDKKVYTESGEYIGKVEEVILKKNKIETLKIKLDKKKKHKVRGLLLRYSSVKAVKRIIIVRDFKISKE